MKSHKAYSANTAPAFTMIEIIVVVGILALLLSVGSVMAFNSIERSVASNEQNLLATLLIGQRTKALANLNQNSHGLKVETNQYTLFEGNSFAAGTNKRSVTKSAGITTGGASEIIFGQLTGTSSLQSITITDGSMTYTIDINQEGRIEW